MRTARGDGHEHRAQILWNWHHPYYAALLEQAGLALEDPAGLGAADAVAAPPKQLAIDLSYHLAYGAGLGAAFAALHR